MKYIKLFEENKYEWESIREIDGELHVFLYELATEMENSIDGTDKEAIVKGEKEYVNLVRKLLTGKVITFSCADCKEDTHTGICDEVDFSGSGYPGGGFEEENEDEAMFDIQFVHISLEDMNSSHNMEDEEVIIHNEDPNLYRNMKKYNL